MARLRRADGSINWQVVNGIRDFEELGDEPFQVNNKRTQLRESRKFAADVGESDYLQFLSDESRASFEAFGEVADESGLGDQRRRGKSGVRS